MKDIFLILNFFWKINKWLFKGKIIACIFIMKCMPKTYEMHANNSKKGEIEVYYYKILILHEKNDSIVWRHPDSMKMYTINTKTTTTENKQINTDQKNPKRAIANKLIKGIK